MASGDLAKAPLGQFFREAILRTFEGWIWLGTFAAYLAAFAACWFVPDMVIRNPDAVAGPLIIFGAWPVVSFVVYVVVCSPHFTTSVFGSIVMAVFALSGFWIVYR